MSGGGGGEGDEAESSDWRRPAMRRAISAALDGDCASLVAWSRSSSSTCEAYISGFATIAAGVPSTRLGLASDDCGRDSIVVHCPRSSLTVAKRPAAIAHVCALLSPTAVLGLATLAGVLALVDGESQRHGGAAAKRQKQSRTQSLPHPPPRQRSQAAKQHSFRHTQLKSTGATGRHSVHNSAGAFCLLPPLRGKSAADSECRKQRLPSRMPSRNMICQSASTKPVRRKSLGPAHAAALVR